MSSILKNKFKQNQKLNLNRISINGKLLDDKTPSKSQKLTRYTIIDLINLENDKYNFDYREEYKNQLEQLKSMGYNDENTNLEAQKT